MLRFRIQFPGHSHEVWLGENITSRLSNFSLLKKASRVFIFADARLKTPMRHLEGTLKEAGMRVKPIPLQVSEDLKLLDRIYPLYGQLMKSGADRHSVLIALGGGVVGDAIGFVAGTFMRGIPWIGIPTTLLAQVDSSVGGKTGINHEFGKNLIGAFHQPSLVVCESSFLQSLQPRDLVSGLGEMIKYGLISDTALFSRLKKNWKNILHIQMGSSLVRDIQACLKLKGSLVVQDERDETGIREVLNFGHTFGHALEAESRYGYFRHGEAIIYGMRVACALSVKRGHLDNRAQKEIDYFLASIPVPVLPKSISVYQYVKRIRSDKKARSGKVRFVLLKKVGETVLDSNVSETELADSISEIVGKQG